MLNGSSCCTYPFSCWSSLSILCPACLTDCLRTYLKRSRLFPFLSITLKANSQSVGASKSAQIHCGQCTQTHAQMWSAWALKRTYLCAPFIFVITTKTACTHVVYAHGWTQWLHFKGFWLEALSSLTQMLDGCSRRGCSNVCAHGQKSTFPHARPAFPAPCVAITHLYRASNDTAADLTR